MIQRLFTIFSLLGLLLLAPACSDDEPQQLPKAPVITLDSESAIYVAKAGREIEIVPSYAHAEGATYLWQLNGSTIGDTPTLRFSRDETGSYYITLTVTTASGSDSKELRVDVIKLAPPVVTLAAGIDRKLLLGSSLTFEPLISSATEYTCTWSINGEVVSTDKDLLFRGDAAGEYRLCFAASNEDGTAEITFTVTVATASEIGFDWQFEQTTYNVALGRTIRLRAIEFDQESGARFTWSVDGETVHEDGRPEYHFTAETEGSHTVVIEMDNGQVTASQQLTVNVCPAEGHYRRAATASSTAACNRVYEFLPAPGQFINEGYTATTMEEACSVAEELLAKSRYVSLGGFGGSIVVGFDHSIANSGDYDIVIQGNPFDGSSEPGVVWVMQDENGDGLPNDTWYELRGSEYGKPETLQDYAVTYDRPSAAGQPVPWHDNQGQSGIIDHLIFHTQDYYYPAWVTADSYTLRGTRLKERVYNQGDDEMPYWVLPAYDWGYVDNFSSVDLAATGNRFRIRDAVTFDGRDADLAYIDFVKVQVAINAQCGWLGEASTEVFGISDCNLNQ